MGNHQKPTKEELDAGITKTLQALEKTEEEQPQEETPQEPEEESREEEVLQEEEQPQEEPSSEEEPDEEEDVEKIKTQRAESTKEAQKLAEDKKLINEAFHEAENIPDPTVEELQAEYPLWDEMDDTTRRLAKDNFINKKWREAVSKANAERKVVKEWDNKVDTFLDNPKTFIHNPDLEGKQEEFKSYAKDESRRNVNFDLIVKSFLYDVTVTRKNESKNNKGKMMETGTGGENVKPKPKSDTLSVDEGRKLMNVNYKKYVQYLKAGKIANF
jgi:hypothetical protein